MTRFRQALARVWRSWGQGPTGTSATDAKRRLDVLLALPDGRRMLVGSLTFEDGEYVFRYSDGFKRQTDVPPIGAFPDPNEEYRSPDLFPFFDVRLPPIDRADVRRVVLERHIDPEDKFHLLGELARRTVTSPYDLELRLEAAGA
jgi:HipA-like protein